MIGVGIPLTGNLSCSIPTIVKAASGAAVSSLVADGTNVYWIESGTSIKSTPVAGGAIATLVSGRTPQGIQVANGLIYWTDQDDSINAVPTGGGSTVQIKSSFGSGQGTFRVDATRVFLRNGLSITLGGGIVNTVFTPLTNSGTLALDSGNAYWTEATSPGNLKQVSKGGGAVTTLVSNTLPPPFWVASDGTNVYWATHGAFGGPFTLSKTPVGGGSTTSLSSPFIQAQIFVDSSFVYFHNDGNGAISKIKLTGGNITPFVANISPYNLMNNGVPVAIDSNSIYWINFDNSIWKIDKCTTVPV